jgi:hypothetical protein
MKRYDLCDHDEPLDLEEGLTVAARKQLPLEDFAWPEQRKYPITSQQRLDSAARLLGRAPTDMQPKIKARAIAIAKRKGFQLPDSWQADATESVMTESVGKPLKKIATLNVCWLEYNAQSLNGRIYPKATCDAIYASGQRKLADPFGLPVTCFVSHEAANGNVNTELVGRAVKLWQEGQKFYALIDLADTTAARDMLALAEGGYLASESMRVWGVKLVYDENYDLPLVVPEDGYEPELMGIDLTTRPGLQDTARILAVLYEHAHSQQPFIEAFALSDVSIDTPKGDPMPIPIFLKVIAGALEEAMTDDRKAHQRVHDHLAGVLDATVADKHGAESARYRALVEAELSEEGKAIAQKHAVRLAAAHDESAKQLGMSCEGAYNEALGVALDPDQDDDSQDPDDDDDPQDPDDDEEESMTPQQMMEALKKAGYAVNPPKSSEQQLQEAFDAKLAEQERKFNERLAALQGEPQRKTQALIGDVEESTLVPEPMYESGDYLSGMLAPKNWKALADRRVPWPKDIDPKLAVHEMAPFLAYRMNLDDAHARGRDITAFIDQYEQV